MKCAWRSLINILPMRFRSEVDSKEKNGIQEIRLRLGSVPELVCSGKSLWMNEPVVADDISFVVNAASRYSPWAASTIRKGYITAQGGHRVGLCGDAVIQNGEMMGIRNPVSLCIRISRDFPDIAKKAADISGSILIIGKPGSGKTTLLRDLVRQRSDHIEGSVGVVDERGEIFPMTEEGTCFSTGKRTDVITGCSKEQGIDVLLRTMGPHCIAVDEITAESDCRALINAGWSGVSLLATAHAECVSDLKSRAIYRPLLNTGLFRTVLVLRSDKSWVLERV